MELIIVMAIIFIPIFIFINTVGLLGELRNKKETKRDKIEGAIFCVINIVAFSVALFL